MPLTVVSDTMPSSARESWADLLKVIAILAVITIHASAPLLVRYKETGLSAWWVANMYNSLSRWCIPVFFMLSGCFLVPKAGKSLSFFLLRRVQRIVIPFIIWSFIYFKWRVLYYGQDLSLSAFFPMLISEPIYYHLWFFYVLIVLYFLAPILSIYFQNSKPSINGYFLLLWFFAASVYPLLERFLGFSTFFSFGNVETSLHYLGFFMMGYLLRDIQLNSVERLFFFLLFLCGLFLTSFGSYFLSIVKKEGVFDDFFYIYYTPNVAIMAVSVFLLMKSIPFPKAGILLSFVASCVPGIFLVHAMVIALLKQGVLGITVNEVTYGPVWGIPLFTGVIFILSLLVIAPIKLVPGLKYIVP